MAEAFHSSALLCNHDICLLWLFLHV